MTPGHGYPPGVRVAPDGSMTIDLGELLAGLGIPDTPATDHGAHVWRLKAPGP